MFFGHDLKLQTGFTDISEPVLFSILFGFEASVATKCISCSESFQLLDILNEMSIFEISELSTNGPLVDHRWPVVGYHGLSVREQTFDKKFARMYCKMLQRKAQFLSDNLETFAKFTSKQYDFSHFYQCARNGDLHGESRNK